MSLPIDYDAYDWPEEAALQPALASSELELRDRIFIAEPPEGRVLHRMATPSVPSIACIGIIGKHDNPLHIALFPPHVDASGAYLEFSFILNASLDVFDLRARDKSKVDQDLGLLHAIDERLSVWGWETGSGTKFAIVLDMWGRENIEGTGLGIKDGELKPAFRALQTAYIHLLQNPFYVPDDHTPMAAASGKGDGSHITSRKFVAEVQRIGMAWKPGVTAI